MKDILKEILSHINSKMLRKRLMECYNWKQITSSLRVIDDTQLGIEHYKNSNYPDEIGGKYVYTYGLLQMLFVQQDAVINFGESLRFKCKIEDIKEIRDIRNDIVGHPTKRGIKNCYHNYLVQNSLNKVSFEYLTTKNSNDTRKNIVINIKDIINKQEIAIKSILNYYIKELMKFENNIKEEFEGKRITEEFTVLDNYIISVIQNLKSNKKALAPNIDEDITNINSKYLEIFREIENRKVSFHLQKDIFRDIEELIEKIKKSEDSSGEILNLFYDLKKKIDEFKEFCIYIDDLFELPDTETL